MVALVQHELRPGAVLRRRAFEARPALQVDEPWQGAFLGVCRRRGIVVGGLVYLEGRACKELDGAERGVGVVTGDLEEVLGYAQLACVGLLYARL